MSAPAQRSLDTGFGGIPLQFIPNGGQMDRAVAFFIGGRDQSIYFTAEGLTFSIANDKEPVPGTSLVPRWVVKLDFVDAKKGVVPVGLQKSGTVVSYFKGERRTWKAGLAACTKIVYRDLWPGIDLVYSGAFNRLKYEFVVRPGADPSSIGLTYRGAEGVTLTTGGRLAIRTPAGSLEDDAPIAYQEIDGARRDVPVAFDLETATYGFTVGSYDRSRTLVIDPSSLLFCGFIGGLATDTGNGIALDSGGSAYIVGTTTSSEATFPVNVGPDPTFNDGAEDAFIAKVSPDGRDLVYCGYIGGAATDRGLKVAVDAAGNAYVTGSTDSNESTFPVVTGPDLTFNGGTDAFVAKVDPSGTGLIYCGYIGGASVDKGNAIAVDGQGNAYISGGTSSDETTFPAKVGPDLTHNGFASDAFVAKVDASGTELAYCGYIGGLRPDSSQGIAVDGSGNAYVSGYAMSSDLDGFPVAGAPGLPFTGSVDAFVAKVNSLGTALDFCGYCAGGNRAYDSGVAVDGAGNIYVVGYLVPFESPSDAFFVKLDPSGALVYSRTMGGTGDDWALGIAVDVWENVYIVGTTNSNEQTFRPTVGPGLVRKYHSDNRDVFVAKVDASGWGPFVYCGFIGGFGDDYASGIAVDGSGNAYVVGTTTDGDWAYFPAIGGPGLTYNGGDSDAFVAKVPPIPAVSNPTLTSVQPTSTFAGDTPVTVILEGSDFVYGAYAYWRGSPRTTRFISDTQLASDSIASDLWEGGRIEIAVHNPDGQPAGSVWLDVVSPVPVLNSLSPAAATVGNAEPGLRLLGANFLRSSIIRWNGAALSTGWDGYVNSGTVDANIPPADLAAGGEFQVTVENPAPGGGISAPVVFRIATFTLSATPASATVNAGQSANYTVLLAPQFGSFDAPVTFSCEGLPKASVASYSPPSATPGAAALSVGLTLRTKAPASSAAAASLRSKGFLPPALGLLLIVPAVLSRLRSRASSGRSRIGQWLAVGALALFALIMVSCGTGGGGQPGPSDPGTPPGTYEVTVKASSGSLTVTTPVTLIVR